MRVMLFWFAGLLVYQPSYVYMKMQTNQHIVHYLSIKRVSTILKRKCWRGLGGYGLGVARSPCDSRPSCHRPR